MCSRLLLQVGFLDYPVLGKETVPRACLLSSGAWGRLAQHPHSHACKKAASPQPGTLIQCSCQSGRTGVRQSPCLVLGILGHSQCSLGLPLLCWKVIGSEVKSGPRGKQDQNRQPMGTKGCGEAGARCTEYQGRTPLPALCHHRQQAPLGTTQ